MYDAFIAGLQWGAGFCLFMGVLIYASLRQNPLIWLGDAPKEVQQRFGPPDERTRRQRRGWALVMGAGVLAIFTTLAVRTAPLGGWAVALATLTCFELFNLFDALVIDVGLVVFKPSWAFPPGAADSPAYRDVRWHLTNWLKGAAGGFVVAGLVTGLTLVAQWLTSR
jgi:hypothetical protein